MLTVSSKQKFLSLSEIFPISKLLLRWPHDSHNTILEYIGGKRLVLYTLESIAKNSSGNFCGIITEMNIASWEYDILRDAYSNIVVIERNVEDIEAQCEHISYVSTSSMDNVLITSEKNLGIAAENCIHMLATYKL